MIRLDYYVRRRASLGQEEFQARWLQDHSRLWVKHADTLGLKRYRQLHDWPDHPFCAAWREMHQVQGQAFDGVSTMYWPSYRILVEALESDTGQYAMAEILDDEGQFIDMANSRLSFGVVHPVINGREKIVASEENDVFCGMYLPQVRSRYSADQIQRHWIAMRCGLSQESPIDSPHLRYHQVHAVDYPLTEWLRQGRGMSHRPHHVGHAEAWSSPAEMKTASAEPGHQEPAPLFLPDVATFSETSKGCFVAGKEFHLVDEELYELSLPVPEDFWP